MNSFTELDLAQMYSNCDVVLDLNNRNIINIFMEYAKELKLNDPSIKDWLEELEFNMQSNSTNR